MLTGGRERGCLSRSVGSRAPSTLRQHEGPGDLCRDHAPPNSVLAKGWLLAVWLFTCPGMRETLAGRPLERAQWLFVPIAVV